MNHPGSRLTPAACPAPRAWSLQAGDIDRSPARCCEAARPAPAVHEMALEEEQQPPAPEEDEATLPDVGEPGGVVVLRREDLPSETVEAYPASEPFEMPLDDLDADGVLADVDPDDENGLVPGLEVPCNGVDEDGDGIDACPPDADGDGVRADLDCDDGDPGVSPIAPDIHCDGIDENCNGFDECDRDADGALDQDDPDPDDPDVRAP